MSGVEPESSEQRSESLVALALLSGWVTDDQVNEAEALCHKLRADGLTLSVMEALTKKGHLSPEQAAELDRKRRAAKFSVAIEGYELISKLGQGAMGTVFKAMQKSTERLVAVKILAPAVAKQPGFVERFVREARSSALVNHPNIIRGIDVGESNGLHYFVMEYVEGVPLRHLLKTQTRLAEAEVLRIGILMASALEAASGAGFVHRDIKPDNILIEKSGAIKLCDLGLSKRINEDSSLTQSGKYVGTPMYIAPEQARGEKDIDVRTDIYSLGATLYHLLTGFPLFQADTSVAVVSAHLMQEAPSPRALVPEVSQGLTAILRKMVAKEAAHRYLTAEALRHDLEALRDGRPPEGARAFRGKSSIAAETGRKAVGVGPSARTAPSEARAGLAGRTSTTHAARTPSVAEDEEAPAGSSRGVLVGLALCSLALLVIAVLFIRGVIAQKSSVEAAFSETRRPPLDLRPTLRKPPEPAALPVVPPLENPLPGILPGPPKSDAASEPNPTGSLPAPTAPVAAIPPLRTAALPSAPSRWEYAFRDAAELKDWTPVEPGWIVTGEGLTCPRPSLNQRIEFSRVLSGPLTITYEGITGADLGLSLVDADNPARFDRVVVGGMTGHQVGLITPGKAAPNLMAQDIADGKIHRVAVMRTKESLTLSVDDKELVRLPSAQTNNPDRCRIRLHLWEKPGRFTKVVLQGEAEPIQPAP